MIDTSAGAAEVGMPTCRGVEHVSMTVADLDRATAFFTQVFGCTVLYTMGPFSGSGGSFMRVYANSDVRTVVEFVRVLRSPFLNIELFQVRSPVQRTRWPDLLDIGGWHLAAYVDDIDAATAFLAARDDVYVLGDGKKPTGGVEAGEGSYAVHAMTDWGFHFELLTYPHGRAYTELFETRLWNPSAPDRGAADPVEPQAGSMPTFRGFEHLSVTVADLDAATDFLVGVLGCEQLYDLEGPFNRGGSGFGAYANVDVRAEPSRVRLFRGQYLNVEVVECPPYPGQSRDWPGILDVGGWHLAVYVDDVGAALEFLETSDDADVRVFGGKKPAYDYEAGEEAYTVHAVHASGIYFELVTYPHGRTRQADHVVRAWHPARPSG
jgi:catechol 2,3-dioxygenase-like lactoylglutathione lyase family enzyme